MKKKVLLIAATAVLATAIFARPGQALTVGIGPTCWYSWWKPAFDEGITTMSLDALGITIPTLASNYSMDSAFMYGPILSIGHGRWTFTSVFIYGKYKAEASGLSAYPSAPVFFSYDINIQKYDLDSTMNFALSRFMKIFFGFKYQRYGYNSFNQAPSTTFTIIQKRHFIYNAYGTGIGLAFTINLIGDLYLLWNISAIYMLTSTDYDNLGVLIQGAAASWMPVSGTDSIHCFGGNTTISLAYYIEAITTTLSVGFRFQYIGFLPANDDAVKIMTRSKRDQFYGVMVSAVYNLNFDSSE